MQPLKRRAIQKGVGLQDAVRNQTHCQTDKPLIESDLPRRAVGDSEPDKAHPHPPDTTVLPRTLCCGRHGPAVLLRGGGGGGWHKASVSDCLPLAAPIGLSPLLILTLCGSERVLVVSTEPPDDLSCLTTPGPAGEGGGRLPPRLPPTLGGDHAQQRLGEGLSMVRLQCPHRAGRACPAAVIAFCPSCQYLACPQQTCH